MNTKESRNAIGGEGVAPCRPQFALCHANAKGTGCAIKMELVPAEPNTDGYIRLRMANQMTIGNRMGPNPTYPMFGWDNAIEVNLDFNDLCQILQVFRGECESIAEGKGLYHTTSTATTKILFRHIIDPVAGYSLEVYRTPRNGGEDQRSRFLFTPAESCGLCEAIADVMGTIVFGMPVVIPHE